MESYLVSDLYDLVSPDGKVTSLQRTDPHKALVDVKIENISPAFIGFQLEKGQVFFNIKSTLAQIGMDAIGTHYELDQKKKKRVLSSSSSQDPRLHKRCSVTLLWALI